MNKTYRQSDCFDLCFYEKVKLECNCSAPLSLVNEQCNKTCYDREDIRFHEKNVYTKCSPKCPLECESIKFTITTSLADFPGW